MFRIGKKLAGRLAFPVGCCEKVGKTTISEPISVEDGTILDGRGLVVRVPGDVGGLVCSGRDVTIRNFVFEVEGNPTKHVLFFKDAERVTLENVRVRGKIWNETAGICFLRGLDFKVRNCFVEGMRYGFIFSTGVKTVEMRGCTALGCKTGTYVMGQDAECEDVLIQDCRFIGPGGGSGENGHDGILLERTRFAFLKNNRCYNNEEHGIYLSGSYEVQVQGNFCLWNGWNGIQGVLTKDNLIFGNFACFNGDNGIYLDRDSGSVCIRNRCLRNGRWGILRVSSDDTVLARNLVHGNKAGSYGQM